MVLGINKIIILNNPGNLMTKIHMHSQTENASYSFHAKIHRVKDHGQVKAVIEKCDDVMGKSAYMHVWQKHSTVSIHYFKPINDDLKMGMETFELELPLENALTKEGRAKAAEIIAPDEPRMQKMAKIIKKGLSIALKQKSKSSSHFYHGRHIKHHKRKEHNQSHHHKQKTCHNCEK